MKLTIEQVEFELNAEDMSEIRYEIGDRIRRDIADEVAKRLSVSPEWKEISRSVYASVLARIRNGIVAQWKHNDPNIERSPMVKALAEQPEGGVDHE